MPSVPHCTTHQTSAHVVILARTSEKRNVCLAIAASAVTSSTTTVFKSVQFASSTLSDSSKADPASSELRTQTYRRPTCCAHVEREYLEVRKFLCCSASVRLCVYPFNTSTVTVQQGEGKLQLRHMVRKREDAIHMVKGRLETVNVKISLRVL